jgi:ATP-dependent Clp protease ATP-binding subunit ClpA
MLQLESNLETLLKQAGEEAKAIGAPAFGLAQVMIALLKAGEDSPLWEFLKNEVHCERLLEHFEESARAVHEHQEANPDEKDEAKEDLPFLPSIAISPDEALQGLFAGWMQERGDEILTLPFFVRLLLLNWDGFYPITLEKLGIEIETEEEGAHAFLDSLFAEEFDLGRRYGTPMQGLLQHEAYTHSMMEVLVRRYRQNLMLYGPVGSGKSTVLRRLIENSNAGKLPKIFQGRRYFEFSHEVFLKGVKDAGDLAFRFDALRDHLEGHPEIIMVVNSIQHFFQSDNPLMLDFVQRLLRLLEFKRVHFVLLANLDFYNRIYKANPRFEEVIAPLYIASLSRGEVVEILMQVKDRFEDQYEEELTEEKISVVVEMADEHIRSMHFPKKALILLDVTLSIIALSEDDSLTWNDALKTALSRITGRKDANFPELKERLAKLEADLSQVVLGQKDAITEVCRTIRFMKSDLDLNPDRPDGVFLLAGPAGVGKQLFAAELSRHLFGRDPLLLDLSAYSEAESLKTLMIGTEEGREPSLLAEIREEPRRVLILKNIEYAAPEVLMYFLQGFEEGLLRDASGLRISVGEMTVLLLSDLVGRETKGGFGFMDDPDQNRAIRVEDLREYFSVELLNSVDKLVVFQHLSEEALREILSTRIVPRLREKVQRLGHQLEISDEVADYVAHQGSELVCNARNVDRKFEELVAERVNEEILKAGGGRLSIDVLLIDDEVQLSSKALK